MPEAKQKPQEKTSNDKEPEKKTRVSAARLAELKLIEQIIEQAQHKGWFGFMTGIPRVADDLGGAFGYSPGSPSLMVHAMRGQYGAFFILVKAPHKKGDPAGAISCKVSSPERAWMLIAKDAGYATMVSNDLAEIENALEWYMRGDGIPAETRRF